jgi:hypothetical protein
MSTILIAEKETVIYVLNNNRIRHIRQMIATQWYIVIKWIISGDYQAFK